MDENFDVNKMLEELRKSAVIKAGAAIFGEAQMAYYETIKSHMSEEMGFNMLAHTTEHFLKSIAMAAGPVAKAIMSSEAGKLAEQQAEQRHDS